jgi:glucans biosynthesis protein C
LGHRGLALGPLFLVAGWFSARSLARKGAGAFAGTRLRRLGVPLIVFIFLINPLATYLGNFRGARHPSLADYLGGTYGAGPMWFVAALLAFSLAYALLRRPHRHLLGAGGPGPRSWWPPPS